MRNQTASWQKSIVSLVVFVMTCSPLVAAAQSTSTVIVPPPPVAAPPPPPASAGGANPNLLLAAFGITAAMWLASQAIANEQCTEFKGPCKYQQTCKPNFPRTPENIGIIGKSCNDPRGVSGMCEKFRVCKATSVSGFGGGSGVNSMMGALQTAMTLAQLLAMMNAANSASNGSNPMGPTGCTNFYQVATPTPQDPCAYYVPGTNSISNGINSSFTDTTPPPSTSASDLFHELYGGTGADTSTRFRDDISNLASSTIDISTVTTGATATTTNGKLGVIPLNAGTNVGVTPGVSGNVVITDRTATVIVTRQGTSSTVAGFYGTESSGGVTAQTGTVSNWCRSRPWANNFLRYIIPATFFDSLCTLRGYQVGTDAPTRSPGLNTTTIKTGTQTSFTSTPVQQGTTTKPIYNGPKPQVDIWAVPPTVKLGSRTTVFWSAKNVSSCVESSPDGNFAQSTLSGGAATVALSGPTTFTISCNALDGSHPTDFVTINVK